MAGVRGRHPANSRRLTFSSTISSIFDPKPFEQIPDEDWVRFFEVNVMSGVRLSRHYLPGMEQRNWGRIVFISSESAVQIPAEMIHYGMTKTAQLAISRGLAETTVGTGVTVNRCLPGPTASEGAMEFVGQMAKEPAENEGEVEERIFPNMRPTSLLRALFETPQEVAAMVDLRLQSIVVRLPMAQPCGWMVESCGRSC